MAVVIPYVRLTFLPAGAKRRRTTWAEKLAPNRYRPCDKEGETWTVRKGIDTQELIILAPSDFVVLLPDGKPTAWEIPATMNLRYAELELTSCPNP